MQSWWSRPLEPIYAAVFIDAIRSRSATGRSPTARVCGDRGRPGGLPGRLGVWVGDGGGESAKLWMSVLTDLPNRGVRDMFFVVYDGRKGLPDSGRGRLAGGHRAGMRHPPDPRHVALRLPQGLRRPRQRPARSIPRRALRRGAAAFDALDEKWGQRCAAVLKMWRASLGGVHTVPELWSLSQNRSAESASSVRQLSIAEEGDGIGLRWAPGVRWLVLLGGSS